MHSIKTLIAVFGTWLLSCAFSVGSFAFQTESVENFSEERAPLDPHDASGAPIVYILAGQSNMHGQAPMNDQAHQILAQDLPVDIFCAQPYHFIDASDQWRWDIPATRWERLKPCGVSSETFGPELSLGASLVQRYPGRRIKIIKFAHGGTSLFCEWQPPERSPAYLAMGGDQICPRYLQSISYKTPSHPWAYRRLLATIAQALKTLEPRPWNWGGIAWVQGEADADGRDGYPFLTDGYRVNLRHFVKTLRSKVPDGSHISFVAAQIKCGYHWDPSGRSPVKVVRDSTAALTAEVPGFFTTDTWDLSMQEALGDCCHYGSASMLTLGERLARALAEEADTPPRVLFPPPQERDCQSTYGQTPP